jgi:glycosyltransferase 2 family protein
MLARVNWHIVGVVACAAVIAVSLVVLYRILSDIDVAQVVAAVTNKPWHDIGLAIVCVLIGYLTLTFYDLFALRTIGRPEVPYRIAALASFSSYSIGHNLGATAFTSAAVRLRVYSRWGLGVVDVAKICFITGLTFWLGNIAVLGLGIVLRPEAAAMIDQLPAWLNRALALVALIALAVYVAWIWRGPRLVGRNSWQVRLPSGPLTLLQISIGIVDLTCCSLAMYLLLPASPPIDFLTLAVIFIAATLLGFASHAPGALGVFDAAMLLALWQFDKEQLLASLLLFRLFYFIIPFILALVVLGVREAMPGSFQAATRLAETKPQPRNEV